MYAMCNSIGFVHIAIVFIYVLYRLWVCVCVWLFGCLVAWLCAGRCHTASSTFQAYVSGACLLCDMQIEASQT